MSREQLTGGQLADLEAHQNALKRFKGKMPKQTPPSEDQLVGDLIGSVLNKQEPDVPNFYGIVISKTT